MRLGVSVLPQPGFQAVSGLALAGAGRRLRMADGRVGTARHGLVPFGAGEAAPRDLARPPDPVTQAQVPKLRLARFADRYEMRAIADELRARGRRVVVSEGCGRRRLRGQIPQTGRTESRRRDQEMPAGAET